MNPSDRSLLHLIRRWVQVHAPETNHNAVIKDVFAEVEITPGYFLALNVANLIALCGLLLGSSPVIIGAMLISPLMGPILSFGFAFVTGDDVIWRRAIRKLILSVVLSILVAALATLVSPLKEATGEILARIRPNLYDLIIAFLAGVVGAGALCTKKRYLTVVPGVAIATAVIPPLSVAGFGVGTLNLKVFSGGFLLFFTNFVAIVLSTCAVFYYYGFRRKMATEIELSQMKKRFAFLVGVLVLISIPLVYTLHQSITEVRRSAAVRAALLQELEQEKRSHLVHFRHAVRQDGSLEINAQVNTVSYFSEEETARVERQVGKSLGRKTTLNLEQVLVQAGGLKPELPKPPAAPPPRPPGEAIRSAGEGVRLAVRKSVRRIDRIIAPAAIADFTVAFRDSSEEVSVRLTIRRDAPVSEDESLWIGRMLSADLELPVAVAVETVPFVPLLLFEPGQAAVTEQIKQAILPLREIYRQGREMTVTVEGFAERSGTQARKLAEERVRRVTEILVKECQVPAERIRSSVRVRRQQPPAVRISLLNGGGTSARGD